MASQILSGPFPPHTHPTKQGQPALDCDGVALWATDPVVPPISAARPLDNPNRCPQWPFSKSGGAKGQTLTGSHPPFGRFAQSLFISGRFVFKKSVGQSASVVVYLKNCHSSCAGVSGIGISPSFNPTLHQPNLLRTFCAISAPF